MPWTPTDERRLVVFTIYDHPADHPDSFAVRRWTDDGGEEPCPGELRLAGTLAEARALVPEGLSCIGRHADDDPSIVESWV